MRVREVSRILLTVAAAAALLAPARALGQGSTANPFTPGLPGATPTVTAPSTPNLAVPTTTTTAGGGGLSGGAAVAIGIGALVVLGGISLFIWRDARRRAPVRQRALDADGVPGRAGSKARTKPRRLSPAERRRRKRGRAR